MLESVLLVLSVLCYFASLIFIVIRKDKQHFIALICGVLFHFSTLVTRSIIANHAPLSNMYETMLLFPFLLSLRLIFRRNQIPNFFRIIIIVFLQVLNMVALFLPASMKTPKPLMPALNSFWIYIHVPAYFIGYVSGSIAFLYAMVILYKLKFGNERNVQGLIRKMDSEVKTTFLFLNIGMITGAVWAYYSWGNYWFWDPKETWSLINILVLSLYFHVEHLSFVKKIVIVIIAFLTMAFTYWGVSFILSGIHSYA